MFSKIGGAISSLSAPWWFVILANAGVMVWMGAALVQQASLAAGAVETACKTVERIEYHSETVAQRAARIEQKLDLAISRLTVSPR